MALLRGRLLFLFHRFYITLFYTMNTLFILSCVVLTGRRISTVTSLGVLVFIQSDITPYRAHAHKRYSSMNCVPEHDVLTFFVLHRTKCKPMRFEQCSADFFHHTQNEM